MTINITNAQLAKKISDLIEFFNSREAEFQTWLSGPAGGGDASDGKYPLTDFNGNVRYTKSPAQLEQDVSGLVSSAFSYKESAEIAASNAASSESLAAAYESLSLQHRDNAASYRDAALAAKLGAENAQTNAEANAASSLTHRQNAAASAAAAATSEQNAEASAQAAAAAEQSAASWALDAANSAALAQTFDPTLYFAKSGGQITGDVGISGNLTVTGDINFINSNVVDIGDSILTLNADYNGSTPTENAGIHVNRGTLPLATLLWNEAVGEWQANGGRLWTSANFNPSDFATNAHDHDAVYAQKTHSHNDLYYTEAEIDAFLSNKADVSHTHNYLSTDYLVNRRLESAGGAVSSGIEVHHLASPAGDKPIGVVDTSLLTLRYNGLWSTQLAGDWRQNEWYVRTQNNGTWTGWEKLWHTGNLNPNDYLPVTGGTLSGQVNVDVNTSSDRWGVRVSSTSLSNWSGFWSTSSNWNMYLRDSAGALKVNLRSDGGLSYIKSDLQLDSGGSTELIITGNGPSYHNGAIVLKAQDSVNQRALGTYAHDAGGGNEWFWGRPYSGSDKFAVCRYATVEHDKQTADSINALMTINTSGDLNTVGSISGDRVFAGFDSGVADSISCSGWFRSSGTTGWYNQTYGGGIHMADSVWVRVYGGKRFYVSNTGPDAVYSVGGFSIADGHGKGLRFWGSDYYKIYMSHKDYTPVTVTPLDTSADYNMYFRMHSSNRGWVFHNLYHSSEAAAQITGEGYIYARFGFRLRDSNSTISKGDYNTARITTNSGYVDVGPRNTLWCHFQTDRPAFYMNKPLFVDGGGIRRYQQGGYLYHNSGSRTGGAVTVSTAAPTGGTDGDIWLKV
tara:strand:- start:7644 stop:10190 length:2547 start_codon:yes stop_codon:yes gene_type:complete